MDHFTLSPLYEEQIPLIFNSMVTKAMENGTELVYNKAKINE